MKKFKAKHVLLSATQLEKLQILGQKTNTNVNSLIRMCIDDFLKKWFDEILTSLYNKNDTPNSALLEKSMQDLRIKSEQNREEAEEQAKILKQIGKDQDEKPLVTLSEMLQDSENSEYEVVKQEDSKVVLKRKPDKSSEKWCF